MQRPTQRNQSLALSLVLGFVLVISFQNCGKKLAFATIESVDSVSSSSEAASTTANTSTPAVAGSTSDTGSSATTNTGSRQPASTTTTGPSSSLPPDSIYNVVAADPVACNSMIIKMGYNAACTFGGGCGISCGKPGTSCTSANPQMWGACFNPTNMPQRTSAASLYNFGGGDKAACESSITSRLGIKVACSIGGGCGLSCGEPSSSCASANPTTWGACVDPNAYYPKVTATSTLKLYNFVAGDKASCESSVFSRLGQNVSCSIGGGCGASCGEPSSSCVSANPNSWGACVKAP